MRTVEKKTEERIAYLCGKTLDVLTSHPTSSPLDLHLSQSSQTLQRSCNPTGEENMITFVFRDVRELANRTAVLLKLRAKKKLF